MDPPKQQRALVAGGNGKPAQITQKLVPKLSKGDILIENKVVALNPTDWKGCKFLAKEGDIIGCDFAGVVSEVGPGTDTSFVKVGDRVASFVHGSKDQDVGAFTEYVKTEAELVWKIPDETSFEEAAAIGGIGSETAVQVLFMRLGLPFPGEKSSSAAPTVLIWAGSTSVGGYAIQLAKASGAKVVTTASPKNHDYVKSLGADAAFDYKDPDVASKIKEWAGQPGVTAGLDCVSEGSSTSLAADSFGEDGGKLITLLDRSDVKAPSHVKIEATIVYSCLGKAFNWRKQFDASPEDKAGIVNWHKNHATKLIASGALKANPIRKCPGGLERIPEGMKYMEEGNVSAQKLVYSVDGEFNPVPDALQ